MKEIYSVKDKTNPSLLGIPTTDGGDTTRYLLNAAVEAQSGVGLSASVGTAFTVRASLDNRTVVSGALSPDKISLWVPPPYFFLTAVGISISSMEVTTTGGSVPTTNLFEVVFGKSDLTTSLGADGVFCAATVLGVDTGWGAGTPPSSYFWMYVNSSQWCWVNTETASAENPGLAGGGNRGWTFFAPVSATPGGTVHDRFYLSTTSSGGTPAGMTTKFNLDVIFTGFLHV